MEEELQKCAVAAFEVPTSPSMVEYKQMPLPAPVAGTSAHRGKTKPNRCESPNARGAGATQTVFLLVGVDFSCAEADSGLQQGQHCTVRLHVS